MYFCNQNLTVLVHNQDMVFLTFNHPPCIFFDVFLRLGGASVMDGGYPLFYSLSDSVYISILYLFTKALRYSVAEQLLSVTEQFPPYLDCLCSLAAI